MAKLFNALTVAGGALGGWVSFMLGGWDALAKVLIFFMVFDYTTGIVGAVYQGNLCSSRGFKGILKKLCILMAVCVSNLMQIYLQLPIRDAVMMFFVLNEGLSIVENIGKVIELPPIIQRSLEALRGEEEKKNG